MLAKRVLSRIFILALPLAILFGQLEARVTPQENELLWQSRLPPPRNPTPRNPNVIYSSEGGRVYCGLQQSSAWLAVSAGFTTEAGAEIHCDPSGSLLQWNNTLDAWDDRGYMIGVYFANVPSSVEFAKPVDLVLELDPARVDRICATCLVGKYYEPISQTWQELRTTYDRDGMRIHIEIVQVLPGSGYPDNEDRFIVALFTRTTPTEQAPSATSRPFSTAKPSLASTTKPTADSTLMPSTSPIAQVTESRIPELNTPELTTPELTTPELTTPELATPEAADTRAPEPSSAVSTASPAISPIAVDLGVSEPGAPGETSDSSRLGPLLLAWLLLSVLAAGVTVTVAVLLGKRHKNRK